MAQIEYHLQTKGSLVQFPVRAHERQPHIDVSLPLLLHHFPSLKINKYNLFLKNVIMPSHSNSGVYERARPWWCSKGTPPSEQETSCINACMVATLRQTLCQDNLSLHIKSDLWAFSPTGNLVADAAQAPELIFIFYIADEDRTFLLMSLVQNGVIFWWVPPE